MQGEKEWHRWRATRITATSASVIMDLNPFKDIIELWEELLGIRPPPKLNAKMKRGQDLEPIARNLFIKQTGIDVSPVCGEHDQEWWMAASFDGLSQDHSIICEIKCPSKKITHEEAINNNIPPYYFAQCQHQLFVSNATKAMYTSYFPGHTQEIAIVEILPDFDFINCLREKAKKFYEVNICQMKPPESAWTLSLRHQ